MRRKPKFKFNADAVRTTASVVGGWVGFVGEQSNAVLWGSAASARSVTSQSGPPSRPKIYISRLKFK